MIEFPQISNDEVRKAAEAWGWLRPSLPMEQSQGVQRQEDPGVAQQQEDIARFLGIAERMRAEGRTSQEIRRAVRNIDPNERFYPADGKVLRGIDANRDPRFWATARGKSIVNGIR